MRDVVQRYGKGGWVKGCWKGDSCREIRDECAVDVKL